MSRTGFRPNFDTLEAREVPAVSIYSMDGGQTLRIVGSKDSDEIRIVQDDAHDTLEIYSAVLPKTATASVSDIGVQTFSSSTVKKIVIDLGIGNDAFYYNLAEGSDLTFTKTITLNTGSGDDLVRFETASPTSVLDQVYSLEAESFKAEGSKSSSEDSSLAGFCYAPPMNSTIKAKLTVTVDTGTGNDSVDINVGAIAPRTAVSFTTKLGSGDDRFSVTGDYEVGARATLSINTSGDSGNDFIDANFKKHSAEGGLIDLLLQGNDGDDYLNTGVFGTVKGKINLRQLGGNGNDDLQLNTDVNTESTGGINVTLDGQAGDDSLTFAALGYDAAIFTRILVDGGTGYNVGKLSRDVLCVNLSEVLWLPPLV